MIVHRQLFRTVVISDVPQECPTSLFLFAFAMDDAMESALEECNELDVEFLPVTKLTDIKCAHGIVLPNPCPVDIQTMLNKVTHRLGFYGMHFQLQDAECCVRTGSFSFPSSIVTIRLRP
ncbi:hypothetical protein AHF37_05530 [Paragonimus kellicotti]|nr:hypothetical protein AHF37_05530 [Paragonimus kellicotti]